MPIREQKELYTHIAYRIMDLVIDDLIKAGDLEYDMDSVGAKIFEIIRDETFDYYIPDPPYMSGLGYCDVEYEYGYLEEIARKYIRAFWEENDMLRAELYETREKLQEDSRKSLAKGAKSM